MFDGREMIVDYPCNKHERAPVTFILNLHGTTPVEQHFYQWGYFSAWKHVASHNLVIVTPSSVVTQWGNGDMGVDEPHLLKTIDWVYATFGTKFDIRAMWVGGHSWGSAYTARFGCLDAIKDKVKGLILMSGARAPACASRVSILNSAANLAADGSVKPEALLNQMANATAHGCDAQMMRAIDMNNDETYWPNCDPGWAHANYLMKTKQHATSMDPSVVKSMVDYIKQTRP
jgi:pimeloyl-ACP methyl ester carboxylesterase